MKTYFVFDVESIGIHGEAFSVGGGIYCFKDNEIKTIDEFIIHCDPENAHGDKSDKEWVMQNCPNPHNNPHIPDTFIHASSPDEVRKQFWAIYKEYKFIYKDLTIAAECCWPVESSFLSKCISDDIVERKWQGPYPLIDIASVMFATGMDPMATYERLPNETPAHHPLMDVRQSVRLLKMALDKIANNKNITDVSV